MRKICCLFILVFIIILASCKQKISDNFLNNYTQLNDTNHVFKEVDLEKTLQILESNGYIYFGFHECPFCQLYVPYYNESAKQNNIETIYYFNMKSIREATYDDALENYILNSDFQRIINKLKIENTSEKEFTTPGNHKSVLPWIYAPSIYYIENGNVKRKLLGTIDDYENIDGKIIMTKTQESELKNQLDLLFD